MKLRTKLKRVKEENEWLRAQLLMQYTNPLKVYYSDTKRAERIKLRNVRRIRTDCIDPDFISTYQTALKEEVARGIAQKIADEGLINYTVRQDPYEMTLIVEGECILLRGEN